MKNLIVAAVVIVVIFVAFGLVYGWIEYRRSADKATIDINTNELKRDIEDVTEEAVGAGKKLVDETGDALENAGEELQDSDDGVETENADQEPVEPLP